MDVQKTLFEIGYCWNFTADTPEEALPRLREYGFDGIELWPDGLKQFGAQRWAASLAANGMRCVQLCPYFDFVHGPELIEKSRTILQEFMEAAAILNCGRLRVFTGPPWGANMVGAREATEDQWNSAIRLLIEFCDIAAKQNIELCLECHEGSLMEDSAAALRLLKHVDRKNLKVNLQLPLRDEDWKVSLRQLASYTTHVHIHNWVGSIGTEPLTFLGSGTFDWVPVVQELLTHSPAAFCLSVEHPSHLGLDDPWETARRDGPYLNEMRAKLAITH